ncbi:DUF6680 family protein [Ensifer sp. ENS01]|uniref:DUF6680 family protein n=1 Tax=Ensifer sp. ENS01 TaxID=2769293 RepID=UPI0017853F2F|nr:DUF6680 family protein [Ensifer sp. ENS01]MBD9493182.1 hypothetical protein [Ensifer sp. ENS01]
MQFTEWLNAGILLATIVAIVYGPIKAVKITRNMDDARAKENRRVEIFRNLMRTRQIQLDEEHVYALNLIEIEFYGEEKIVSAYRAYMNHLNTPLPAVDAQDKFFEDRRDLFIDLLHVIGKAVGYEFDRRDLGKFGYVPAGWGNEAERQRYLQHLFIEVLENKRPLPVAPMVAANANPFPPAPEIEKQE